MHILKSSNKNNFNSCTCIITVYRIIFTPCSFCPSTPANNFPHLEFAQTKLRLKRDNLRNLEFAVLNLPNDNEGKRGENKGGGGIFPSIQCIVEIHVQ